MSISWPPGPKLSNPCRLCDGYGFLRYTSSVFDAIRFILFAPENKGLTQQQIAAKIAQWTYTSSGAHRSAYAGVVRALMDEPPTDLEMLDRPSREVLEVPWIPGEE